MFVVIGLSPNGDHPSPVGQHRHQISPYRCHLAKWALFLTLTHTHTLVFIIYLGWCRHRNRLMDDESLQDCILSQIESPIVFHAIALPWWKMYYTQSLPSNDNSNVISVFDSFSFVRSFAFLSWFLLLTISITCFGGNQSGILIGIYYYMIVLFFTFSI